MNRDQRRRNGSNQFGVLASLDSEEHFPSLAGTKFAGEAHAVRSRDSVAKEVASYKQDHIRTRSVHEGASFVVDSNNAAEKEVISKALSSTEQGHLVRGSPEANVKDVSTKESSICGAPPLISVADIAESGVEGSGSEETDTGSEEEETSNEVDSVAEEDEDAPSEAQGNADEEVTCLLGDSNSVAVPGNLMERDEEVDEEETTAEDDDSGGEDAVASGEEQGKPEGAVTRNLGRSISEVFGESSVLNLASAHQVFGDFPRSSPKLDDYRVFDGCSKSKIRFPNAVADQFVVKLGNALNHECMEGEKEKQVGETMIVNAQGRPTLDERPLRTWANIFVGATQSLDAGAILVSYAIFGCWSNSCEPLAHD
ncbi:hypothetical protein U1Q18_036656 [Sarracenia purpurea var. burkii]